MVERREHAVSDSLMQLERHWSASNYAPLPVVLHRGEGAWVTDVEGRRYLDMLGAYSAMSFGHCHPELVATAEMQLRRLTLTSRAFFNDQLPRFCHELSRLCGADRALPMNSGAEAVETAIKAARRWGVEKKGVAEERTHIIVCDDNFHGRTTTIVGFSTNPSASRHFGPFGPGFESVPFGDIEAMRSAIRRDTVAVLIEPIQGEGGVNVPPAGYLRALRELCSEANILLLCDEIQTGLGRTGRLLAAQHEGVVADLTLLGKSLGGGIVPLSAVVGRAEVMDVFTPGSHGSTFGGNPLAAAIGRKVVELLENGELAARATTLGRSFVAALSHIDSPLIRDVRGRGLLVAVELTDAVAPRRVAERLLDRGVLTKHNRNVLRFAPPLTIADTELRLAANALADVLTEEAA